VLDLLVQLPGNFGDPGAMRAKAGHLEQIAFRIVGVDVAVANSARDAIHYAGPAADDFHRTIEARHLELAALLNRVHRVRERLLRAATVMQGVEDEVDSIRARIKRDADTLGRDAGRLVDGAQQLVRDLGNL